MQRSDGGYVAVPLDGLKRWDLDGPLPSPIEQMESLVLWLADQQPTPSNRVQLDTPMLAAWLGVAIGNDTKGLGWLLDQPEVRNLVDHTAGGDRMRLTYQGWTKNDELRRRGATSRTAFMAMKFKDEELDAVFDQCFKPAVGETGFELKRVIDGQGAGCIDDQMRVGLRTSRLVIADLTHGSQGAYWEAGFAEGLGRPVIYTCRSDVWEKERTHFDTNHLVTVVWDSSDLAKAASQLKAIIRATLPDEAQLTD